MYRALAFLIIIIGLLGNSVRAEIDNACWTSPTMKIIAEFNSVRFPSNKAGTTANLSYSSNPRNFTAICNKLEQFPSYFDMIHFVDLGAALQPSTLNMGWYRLSDDVDIKISSTSTDGNTVFFPTAPGGGDSGKLYGGLKPLYYCNECLINGFSVAASGIISMKLRRDIIGGAIIFPRDEKLFTAYRVGYYSRTPPKPSRPIMELYTSPEGTIIPIPTVCEINGGNAINVDFGMVPEDRIGTSVEQEVNPQTVNLSVSCNTALTLGARVRLVSDIASFSNKLIRSNGSNLGVAMRHNGRLIAPFETFPFWLQDGKANEQVTLSLVRNAAAPSLAGDFIASATLVIETQ
ncbi:fimbrial protein [Serratia marcescens]|uniref:fimbrial protein n=1 Tax=Serratia marcescens TaxID=615 RepID=UPI0009B167B1|nr:fimbrial protein [Serratia marcescens]